MWVSIATTVNPCRLNKDTLRDDVFGRHNRRKECILHQRRRLLLGQMQAEWALPMTSAKRTVQSKSIYSNSASQTSDSKVLIEK